MRSETMTSALPNKLGPVDQGGLPDADNNTIRLIDRAIAELREVQEICVLIRKENERARLAAE